MNSKELQIGDFVKVKDYGIKEIVGIRDLDGVIEICDGEDREVEMPFSEIEPIPLTAEILDKNGFDIHETLGEWHPSINGFSFVNKYSDEPLEIDVCGLCVEIRYVHQLQHALRLCGMYDLADNFILKI